MTTYFDILLNTDITHVRNNFNAGFFLQGVKRAFDAMQEFALNMTEIPLDTYMVAGESKVKMKLQDN